MKKLYFNPIFLMLVTQSFAQSNMWIKQIDAAGLKYTHVVEDSDQNLFMAGLYRDSLQLDAQTMVEGIGSFQLFIAKYDAGQTLVDYKIYYTDYEFERPLVTNLEIDEEGQLYLSGGFYNGLYNSEGDTLIYTISSLDQFILKLGNDLEQQWIHRIGGSNNTDIISKIALTEGGNIFLAGAMSRTFDYDLSDSVYSITGGGAGSPFLVKYDSDLNLLWARVFQSVAWESVLDAVIADDGTLYTITQVSDTVIVPMVDDTLLLESLGEADLVINRWDDMGEVLWTQLVKGVGVETFFNAVTDDAGSLYVFLQSRSPVLTIGTEEIVQKEGADLFLAKFKSDGTVGWINQVASVSSESQGKLLRIEDGLVLTGGYSNSLSLNSRDEEIEISLQPGEDYFASYDWNGDLMSVTTLTGYKMRQKGDLRVNGRGQILVSGSVTSITPFHPLPSGLLIPASLPNAVCAKYCIPKIDQLMVDTICLDGNPVFLADIDAGNTQYFLKASGKTVNQDTLFLNEGETEIVVSHFDKEQCPVYEEIDLQRISCSTTAIVDNHPLELTLMPNPFDGPIKLSWEGPLSPKSIFLLDAVGQVILRREIRWSHEGQITLDLGNLVQGIYYLNVRTDGGVIAKKIVKY